MSTRENIRLIARTPLIKLYLLVIKLLAINNDRTTAKEWTAAEAAGGFNALWRQIFTLDSAGFLSKHKAQIEDF